MLGKVVKKERPDLEEKNQELIVSVANGKKTLVDLENKILFLLSSAKGSLLDDASLVDTLQSSKVTSEEVEASLKVAETTKDQIDKARESYRPCAVRASILYFVVSDLILIDPMYQFSLDFYFDLYNGSIDKSAKSEDLEERMKHLNTFHTAAVSPTPHPPPSCTLHSEPVPSTLVSLTPHPPTPFTLNPKFRTLNLEPSTNPSTPQPQRLNP